MRTLAVLSLLLVAVSTSGAFASEDCGAATGRLRTLTTKYRATMADLRAAQGLAGRPADSEEGRLRAQRQFAAAQRDARDQRARLLETYRALIDNACGAYDEDGYDRTVVEFRRLDSEETSILATLTGSPRRSVP